MSTSSLSNNGLPTWHSIHTNIFYILPSCHFLNVCFMSWMYMYSKYSYYKLGQLSSKVTQCCKNTMMTSVLAKFSSKVWIVLLIRSPFSRHTFHDLPKFFIWLIRHIHPFFFTWTCIASIHVHVYMSILHLWWCSVLTLLWVMQIAIGCKLPVNKIDSMLAM